MTTKDLDALAHATREEAFAILNVIGRLRRLELNPADVLRRLADVYEGKDDPVSNPSPRTVFPA